MRQQQNMLFISPRFLFPADSGGKIRTSQILKNLKGGQFRITLLSPATKQEVEAHKDELEQISDEFHYWDTKSSFSSLKRYLYLFSNLPISVACDKSKSGSELVIRELARHQDIVVFDFPHAAVLKPKMLNKPSVMFTHNIEAEIYKRHYSVAENLIKKFVWKNQYNKMKKFENKTLTEFDTVITVSERDSEYFQKLPVLNRIRKIKTGVDLLYYSYNIPEDNHHIVFTGSMDWLANIDGIEFFMDEIWPLVLNLCPTASMTIVGKNPPQSIISKAREKNYRWEFTGFVSDIRPYVKSAAVYVIPLRVAGGTRIKAFEAMAMGCPVVSTSIGMEGLPVTHKKHYLKADSAEDFAQGIISLFKDRKEQKTISLNARKYVEENFSNNSVALEFENICIDTIAGNL